MVACGRPCISKASKFFGFASWVCIANVARKKPRRKPPIGGKKSRIKPTGEKNPRRKPPIGEKSQEESQLGNKKPRRKPPIEETRGLGNEVGETRGLGNEVGETRSGLGNEVGETRGSDNKVGETRGLDNEVGETRSGLGNEVGETRGSDNKVGETGGLDLTLEVGVKQGKHEFRKGKYEGMPVMAKKLERGEIIPTPSRDSISQYVEKFLKDVKYGDDVYLLYRPFLQTLEGFFEENKDVLVPYGVEDKRRTKRYRFSEKARSVVLSAINTLYCAHKNNRTHNQLAGNIFIRDEEIHEGLKKVTIVHYAVLANDFTNHVLPEPESEGYEEQYSHLETAISKDWEMMGEILKGIEGYNDDDRVSIVDYEIRDLINVMCGKEPAEFKDAVAVHSPSLWTNEYRLDFDKWALSTVKDKQLKFDPNEIFLGNNWMTCEPEVLAMTQEKHEGASSYKSDTQEVLVKFIRNLSKHPNGFVAYQPLTTLYENVFDYVRFTFPEYHVLLVKKFINEGFEELNRGLKAHPQSIQAGNPCGSGTGETGNPSGKRKKRRGGPKRKKRRVA